MKCHSEMSRPVFKLWSGSAGELCAQLLVVERLDTYCERVADDLLQKDMLPADARLWVSGELQRRIRETATGLLESLHASPPDLSRSTDSFFAALIEFDRSLCQTLLGFGEQVLADRLRASLQEALAEHAAREHGPAVQRLQERWCPGPEGSPPRFLVALAMAIWSSEVKIECERVLKRCSYPAALPLALFQAVVPNLRSMDLTGHRLFRFGLHTVTRSWAVHRPSPLVVEVAGGLAGLANGTGFRRAGIRRSLEQGARSSFSVGLEPFDSLWSWESRRGSRWHGPGALRWTWSKAFLPGCWSGTLSGQDNYLIPIPPVEPKLIGSPAEHSAQLMLSLLFLREVRLRIEEYDQKRGISMTYNDWRRLADEADLRTPLERVHTAWTEGHDGVGPFVELDMGNRWLLGSSFDEITGFMRKGLELTRAGRRGGNASARSRSAKRGQS